MTEAGLVVQNAATTRRACEAAVNQQEQAFLAVMGSVMPYHIDESGRLVVGRGDAPGFVARRN